MSARPTLGARPPRATPTLPPPVPDWSTIGHLMADSQTVGRALLADDPALGWTAAGVRPAAILLLEPAEPLMAVDPPTGRTFDLQVELLVRRGFGRFPLDAPVPAPLPGWTVQIGPVGLELLDAGGNVWSAAGVTPGPRWLSTVDECGYVQVLYGAWLGVRTPRGVRADQYGPARRAAELRAARMRGLVAAATVAWTDRSVRHSRDEPLPQCVSPNPAP
ncbi:hypothetical protein GCM10010399_24450 [Dactylosporangium fulvum]|uniref:Uncharacterized protein n=1 Tax=Dactylosporangium fulvum TaxID=53359 RepID=A0ABY5W7J2_9ACTN|nr:hypothetical protein [Dactylosporangium fulvum]UWP85512.1 hypothetical protein Dfulv_15230 [Dactylosporangium fulvum]